jgi:hypothetical protein
MPFVKLAQKHDTVPLSVVISVTMLLRGGIDRVFVISEVEDFFIFFSNYIQHCFICRLSNSTVPTDAGIEPGPLQLMHWQSDALSTRLDLIR